MSRHLPDAPVHPEGVKFMRGLLVAIPFGVIAWSLLFGAVIIAVHVAVSGRI